MAYRHILRIFLDLKRPEIERHTVSLYMELVYG